MVHKIVLVDWLDACHNIGTFNKVEAENLNLLRTWNVGFLLHKDKDIIRIASFLDDVGNYRFGMVIPMEQVLKITYLKSKARDLIIKEGKI
jgi:hypothetical protein